MTDSKAWGGRFREAPAAIAERFSASVDVDKRLAPFDIDGSLAHVEMLAACGVVSPEDAARIRAGLVAIRERIEDGRMAWSVAREDVHMNVEGTLADDIGEVAGRLHTGRSRNDQVATDMRLFVRSAIDRTTEKIDGFIEVLLARANETVDIVMPGYTHLQRAQPVRLAHHLHAWVTMLERDHARLRDARARVNESPLGAGALAGTTFPLDRGRTARALGFARPMANSLDAVADRDFLVEVLAALANASIHLSRFSEELVLWSTQEFGFVTMSDAFTTGSSMMPQKKNPDMAELVRGKTGRVVGDLVAMLVTLKGLPLAYNRDLQEDKRPVFDAFDTVDDCLDVLAGAMATAHFHAGAMRAALARGFLDATEVADWLAARGLPFREAHHVAGRLVARAHDTGRTLPELTLDDFRAESALFDESIYDALDLERAIERRDVLGAPKRSRVLDALAASRAALDVRRLAAAGASDMGSDGRA